MKALTISGGKKENQDFIFFSRIKVGREGQAAVAHGNQSPLSFLQNHHASARTPNQATATH
jgi:hypothetical protein